jgi:hypothetical protein
VLLADATDISTVAAVAASDAPVFQQCGPTASALKAYFKFFKKTLLKNKFNAIEDRLSCSLARLPIVITKPINKIKFIL